jgi:hypothetical protein
MPPNMGGMNPGGMNPGGMNPGNAPGMPPNMNAPGMPPNMGGMPPGYAQWGPGGVAPQRQPRGASPTAQDMYERPVLQRNQMPPQVAGFGTKAKPQLLQPWMLIVGALVMAALAFAITRLLLS